MRLVKGQASDTLASQSGSAGRPPLVPCVYARLMRKHDAIARNPLISHAKNPPVRGIRPVSGLPDVSRHALACTR